MKQTHRDEWRVMVTLKPRRPADLGLTGIGELAEFVAPPVEPIRVAVLPRRLGKIAAGMSVSDDMISRDIEGDYRRRCEEIAAELRDRPQVDDVTVTCTETHTCSYCRLRWEVLTEAEVNDDGCVQDEHSIAGEPVCCRKAIDEFRAERGIPLLDEGVVAYRNPSRPGVLLCREHGEGWAGLVPLTSDELPDGGVCTHGDPADPSDRCGRDVLIVEAGEQR
ncbi:hypothetical protein [Streptomyces violarus]|uniref:hypothetical protein n=1 Tax=Streptomyces violarus TaxID=67380 RepID=UPI0021BFDF8B|nr:hypothetical protein [Streptomyces violarus]MCT9139036.1 hypothetical protein [Streptomyces violarus]